MAKKRLTDAERNMVKELTVIATQLPAREKEHLLWLGQGILFATSTEDGKTENN